MKFIQGKGSVVCVVTLFVAGQIGLAALPYLVDQAALLLLVLRPQTEVILLLSDRLSAPVIVMVAAPLRLLFHVAYYELGRWAGERFVEGTRAGRWLLPKLRHPVAVGVLLFSCLLHQSSPVDLALGAQRAERRKTYPVLAVGVVVWTSLLVLLGRKLTPVTTELLELIREHRAPAALLLSSLALTSLVIYLARLRKAGRRP